MDKLFEILLCDARVNPPLLRTLSFDFPANAKKSIGEIMVLAGIAQNQHDPQFNRKGCFGVFGKRKEWHESVYSGDRLELYAPLQIDPKTARRKKANRDKDSLLKSKAKARSIAKLGSK